MKLVTLDGKMNQDEIIVDNFAGGGGASTGIELAIGRSVDVAINHDPDAIAMHTANHPNTKHYCEDVFDIDPLEATQGRKVALCWLSPDCKHFSKAKGNTPVNKNIRGLAWVTLRWASKVHPRVIILENVEEFKTWGPLIPVRDKVTGRIKVLEDVEVDGKIKKVQRIAEAGEVVPFKNQILTPNKQKAGKIFKQFIYHLERLGYTVEWKELRACDYGAPTTRKRFFMIARCDQNKIVWPEPTHGPADSIEVMKEQKMSYRTAAEIIDWNIPGNSIFNRKKPLVEPTLKRIARGIEKYIVNEANPFIVRIGQTGFGGDRLQYSIDKPLTTITTKAEHCLVTPHIMVNTTNHSGSSLNEPLKTITTGGHHALVSPILIQMGYGDPEGKRILDQFKPLGTITSGGNKFATATAFLSKYYGGNYKGAGVGMNQPLSTITTVDHHSLVVAFLTKYYGNDTGQSLNDPLHTIPTKSRFGLVQIKGENYKIVDITLRMLQPHELFLAQGFPENYIIDKDQYGKSMSKAKQIARCGNSVSPPIPRVLVKSNLPELCADEDFVEQVDLFKVGY